MFKNYHKQWHRASRWAARVVARVPLGVRSEPLNTGGMCRGSCLSRLGHTTLRDLGHHSLRPKSNCTVILCVAESTPGHCDEPADTPPIIHGAGLDYPLCVPHSSHGSNELTGFFKFSPSDFGNIDCIEFTFHTVGLPLLNPFGGKTSSCELLRHCPLYSQSGPAQQSNGAQSFDLKPALPYACAASASPCPVKEDCEHCRDKSVHVYCDCGAASHRRRQE